MKPVILALTLAAALCSHAGGRGFKEGLEFETIPDEENDYLSGPTDIEIDGNGNILILDVLSRTVFVWDKDGKYLTSFGSGGQGPGEFSFRSFGTSAQGFISFFDGKIHVYDSGPRKISVFNENFEYVDAFPFTIKGAGRIEHLRIIDDERIFVHMGNLFNDPPYRLVGIFTPEARLVNELLRMNERTWRRVPGKTLEESTIVLHPYSETVVAWYDAAIGTIMVGDSDEPSFKVYGADAKLIRKVTFRLRRIPVTKTDQFEFEDQEWFKGQRMFQVEFKDYKGYYDRILPFQDQGYLVYTESPRDRRSKGLFIDFEGKTLNHFELTLGNSGVMLGARGRLFAIVSGEERFRISEILPRQK